MNHPKVESLPFDAKTLSSLLEGATPGRWGACSCDKCGLVWEAGGQYLILSANPYPEEDVPCIPQEQVPFNRTVIAYLMTHAGEIVEMLKEKESRQIRSNGEIRSDPHPSVGPHVDGGLPWEDPGA